MLIKNEGKTETSLEAEVNHKNPSTVVNYLNKCNENVEC